MLTASGPRTPKATFPEVMCRARRELRQPRLMAREPWLSWRPYATAGCSAEARARWDLNLKDVEEEVAVGVGSAALEVGLKRRRMKATVIAERAVLPERADPASLEPADLDTCLKRAGLDRPQCPRQTAGRIGHLRDDSDATHGRRVRCRGRICVVGVVQEDQRDHGDRERDSNRQCTEDHVCAESRPTGLSPARRGRGQLLVDAAEQTRRWIDLIGLCRKCAADFIDDLVVTQHNVEPSDSSFRLVRRSGPRAGL